MADDKTLVQQMLNLGEERMGEVLNQLLANETFVSAMQSAVSSSLSAKRTFDARIGSVLTAVNVPTLEDVAELKGKLEELEDVMAEIEDRVKGLHSKARRREAPAKASHGGDDEPKKAKKKTTKKKTAKKAS